MCIPDFVANLLRNRLKAQFAMGSAYGSGSRFQHFATPRRKFAAISALTANSQIGHFARIAQNYAVRVSEFVRSPLGSRAYAWACGETNDVSRGSSVAGFDDDATIA
ncbi:MAG: hypothetical protein DMF22_11955 [Verrucomicrobia bacterium]|nr:MAG: hypothetical protein DMF22_11955 [Verrucomicrobiota bacterium]